MARHNFREIVLMVLAVLGGLVILLLIGAGLFHVAAGPNPAETGGGVYIFAGGVSVKFLAMLMVTLVVIVTGLAVFLWRR